MIGARVAGFTLTDDMERKFLPRPPSPGMPYVVDIEIVCGPVSCACIYRKADGTWAGSSPAALALLRLADQATSSAATSRASVMNLWK